MSESKEVFLFFISLVIALFSAIRMESIVQNKIWEIFYFVDEIYYYRFLIMNTYVQEDFRTQLLLAFSNGVEKEHDTST